MRSGRFLAAAAIVVLLAGCSGTTPSPSAAASSAAATVAASSGPTAAPTPTANPLAGKTVNVVKSGDHAFDDVSIGYWVQLMQQNYGVTINLTSVASADLSLRAVVSGAADATVAMSLTGLVDLVEQSGTDVKLIAADTYASDYQIVSKASFNTLADLKGATEAISAPGDASELVLHMCLNQASVDYSTVKLARIGGTSARVAAVLSGKADFGAAHIADANNAVAKSSGAIKILADCGKAVGNYPVTGLVATGAYLKANPDLAQAMVNGYVDAMRWAATNKAAYVQFAQTWVPDIAADEASAAYDYFVGVGFWPVNGGIDDAALQLYMSYGAQGGVLVGKVPATNLWVDNSFVKTYLAANGTK